MNYEEFKQNVIAELRGYLAEELKDCEFRESEVKKVNRILDGLTLMKPEMECGPTIYYQDVYEWFMRYGDFEKCMQKVAEFFREGVEELKESTPILYKIDSIGQIKNNLIMGVINTERNSELLKTVPNKTFHDLSVIYRCIVDNQSEYGMSTFLITNTLMQHLGFDEQTLDSCAKRNMRKLLPSYIEEVAPNNYLATNHQLLFGAVLMLDSEFLKELSDKMNDSFYILPASLHEFFAVPVTENEPKNLKQIIREANDSVVSDNDFLSNSLYRFDRDTESVEQVG